MLLVPEGRTGEAWEIFKKQCSSGNQGAKNRKVFSILSALVAAMK
jgi:hypothetical protein